MWRISVCLDVMCVLKSLVASSAYTALHWCSSRTEGNVVMESKVQGPLFLSHTPHEFLIFKIRAHSIPFRSTPL